MTEDREFEGKDLEEALANASAALGIPEEELHYEMLEAGRRGLLGLGVKNVHIRVKPPLEAELPQVESEPAPRRKPDPPAPKKKTPRPETDEDDTAATVDPVAVRAVEETVRRIVEGVGLDLEIELEAQGGGLGLQMRGPDEKLLTAKNAELLGAFQLLLNRMARRSWPEVGRISVGANGPPRARDEELTAMVRKVAKQVARTGKTRRLRPMNAYERRLVHLTVREFGGLSSSSDGNGNLKRVRISKVRNQI